MNRWSALAIASAGLLLVSLDSALNIAFPAISSYFGVSVATIQWLVISYVLTNASLLLGCGRMADLLGHKRVFVGGLALSTLALALCGLAPSYGLLLASRVLQGTGAAMVFASAPAIVTVSFGPGEAGRALGLFNMSGYVGSTSGPIIGGWLVDRFGWRAVYLFRVPIAIATALAAAPLLVGAAGRGRRERFDLVGMGTLATAIVALLLAINRGREVGWAAGGVLALWTASALGFAAFVATERRVAHPIVDWRLFTPGVSLANFANLLANLAMFAVWLLVPYYIVNVLGYRAASGGTLLAPCPLGMALAAPLSGLLSDRFGTRRLQVPGLLIEAAGLYLATRFGAQSSYATVAAALILIGLGLGAFAVANMSFVMAAIPRAQQGVAGGAVMMMRTLGVVMGVTTAAEVFSVRRAAHHAQLLAGAHLSAAALDRRSFVGGFHDAFSVSTAVCLLAALLVALPIRRRAALSDTQAPPVVGVASGGE
ncbi:MAG TPA: DHA2 family efflux MFS transporter permease subunit [Candidatus Binataceae bacterium]|nr:DHA2 family efflux MFS transporter permease subunit [Candidatus Binataceae bacterium]